VGEQFFWERLVGGGGKFSRRLFSFEGTVRGAVVLHCHWPNVRSLTLTLTHNLTLNLTPSPGGSGDKNAKSGGTSEDEDVET
jgi:hypothetical protein